MNGTKKKKHKLKFTADAIVVLRVDWSDHRPITFAIPYSGTFSILKSTETPSGRMLNCMALWARARLCVHVFDKRKESVLHKHVNMYYFGLGICRAAKQ